MSIRPIDFQVSFTRSTETAKPGSNENVRPDLQQQLFSRESEKRTELENTQVVRSSESEFVKVSEEGKGKNEYKKNRKDNKKKDKEQKKTSSKIIRDSTSIYDISI